MGITGKLAADFSAFYEAVQKAEVSLKSFDAGAATVEKSLNRMADTFSGRKTIQEATLMAEAIDRIGGVGKLTEAELQRVAAAAQEAAEKMRALGQEVPLDIQHLSDLAASADAAAPKVDNLKHSFSQFDNILQTLGVNIGPETKALGEIAGASGKTAAQLGTLTTVGLATGAAFAGWKLGRMVAEFLDLDKAIGNATAKFLGFGDVAGAEAGAKQDVITRAIERGAAASISYADALKFNTDWFKKHQEAETVTAEATKKLADEQKAALEKWTAAMVELSSAGAGWEGTLETINGATVEAIKFYLDAGVSQNALADAYGLTATQVKAVASALGAEAKALKESEDAAKKAEAAHQTFLNAMEELNAAGKGWQGTLLTIDGAVVEAIKYYLEAGVSQKALAEAYALTDVQVKAVASSMKAELVPAIETVPPALDKVVKKQQEVIDQFGDITTAAREAARVAGGSQEVTAQNFDDIIKNYATGFSGTSGALVVQHGLEYSNARELAEKGYSFQEIIDWLVKGLPLSPTPIGPRIPGFEQGGPVLQTGLALVHEGEYVVPKSGGGAASAPLTVNVIMDGQVITAIVLDRLTGQMMQERLWPTR